jgi:hypothetical protein
MVRVEMISEVVHESGADCDCQRRVIVELSSMVIKFIHQFGELSVLFPTRPVEI